MARELVIEMPNVSRVAFSDDGGRLIVAGSSGVVVLATGSWDVVEQHRSPDGAIADIAPTKSGEFRAISVSGNRALIWSGKSGFNPVALEGHKERITSAAVSADGLLAATGSVDRIAHVWDAQGGSVLTTLTGHVGTVAAVAFSPDGLRVATVGEEFDRTTRIWDRLTGQELLVLESAPGQNSHLVFGGRGERFAALRGGITIWDARPRNAESAREGAALSAVRFHCSEPAKRTQNRAAIALDPALSAPARRLAISLAEEVFDTLPQ